MKDRKEELKKKRQLLSGVHNFVAMFDGMVHFRDVLKEAVETENILISLEADIEKAKEEKEKLIADNEKRLEEFNAMLEKKAAAYEAEEKSRRHVVDKHERETNAQIEENRKKIEYFKNSYDESVRELEKHKQKVLKETTLARDAMLKEKEEAEKARDTAISKKVLVEQEVDALYARLKG